MIYEVEKLNMLQYFIIAMLALPYDIHDVCYHLYMLEYMGFKDYTKLCKNDLQDEYASKASKEFVLITSIELHARTHC